MYKQILKVTYFLAIASFLLFVFISYFSADNKNRVISNRSNYNKNVNKQISDLPLLKNDTSNIIEYNYEQLGEKKIKKRYFWKLLNDTK